MEHQSRAIDYLSGEMGFEKFKLHTLYPLGIEIQDGLGLMEEAGGCCRLLRLGNFNNFQNSCRRTLKIIRLIECLRQLIVEILTYKVPFQV